MATELAGVTQLNSILTNGASSENDLHVLAQALNLKVNFIGSLYDLQSLKEGNYIILITPSKNIHSGHWTALKVSKDKAEYYDGYGMPPPQLLVDNIHVPLYYNNKQIQDMRSSHCGIYSIYFLKHGKKMLKHFRPINYY